MLDQTLDWQDVQEWVHEVREIPGTSFTLDTKDGFYTESKDPEFIALVREGYKSVLNVEEDVLAQERPVNKVALYHKTEIARIAGEMIPRWSKRVYCAQAGDIWVDFLNKESNKGNAIRSIQKTLGILPEETMVLEIISMTLRCSTVPEKAMRWEMRQRPSSRRQDTWRIPM